ncbi:mitochondrial 39-S ribosomal protein L47 (MRP-L47)-domain-containing protein [Ochromonadaceae sp. CCMP2298]|nr:mitochondrial 39-S ribosomal protein L47 (MRP-L47)-domain-containing protein [Ochromonadaceae sp. CCMP2298]
MFLNRILSGFRSCSSSGGVLGRGQSGVQVSMFHSSNGAVRGFEEFFDTKGEKEVVSTGRAWTVADLRRKSFDDLHKLWYVLYKERNVLLTQKHKLKRTQRPTILVEEHRYFKVKRSMGGIKHVMKERKKIEYILAGMEADRSPESASELGSQKSRE